VNWSPEKGGPTGYPGTNFGAHCGSATYKVNGKSSHLLSDCSTIVQDIPKCQAMGTKVLLSIGGVWSSSGSDYTVSTTQKGEAFATFLWNAFGPYKTSWTGPRPFGHSSVDGFDFDVEKKFADQTPWIAMINKLRSYFGTSGKYVIAGAPQCSLADAYFQMKAMIVGAQFDILWVQFYNNPSCDGLNGGFNFDAWAKFLVGTRSAHASLYIGLPGSTAAAGSGYLSTTNLQKLLKTYASRPSFGGVMLWDASLAEKNVDAQGRTYVQIVKSILATVGPAASPTSPHAPTSTPSCTRKYTVLAGDYCYKIATQYGITVDQIMAQNPKLNSYCDLTKGQVLCLPPLCTKTYKVVSGDTCYKIATSYGITVAKLESFNPSLGSACAIQPGQTLCVKQSTSSTPARAARAVPAAETTVTARLVSSSDIPTGRNSTAAYGTPSPTHTPVYAGVSKQGPLAIAAALVAAAAAVAVI